MRLIDFLKSKQITALLTSLTSDQNDIEQSELGISSLIDTWILLKMIEINGERNRGIYILKSRGMAHSNQIREFQLTNEGIQLLDVVQGAEGVLTGTARMAQEAKERAATLVRQQDIERKQRELERKRRALEVQIDALRAEFDAEEEEMSKIITQVQQAETMKWNEDALITRQRSGEATSRNDRKATHSPLSEAPLSGGANVNTNR
jgi:circadian clock protein KaiC